MSCNNTIQFRCLQSPVCASVMPNKSYRVLCVQQHSQKVQSQIEKARQTSPVSTMFYYITTPFTQSPQFVVYTRASVSKDYLLMALFLSQRTILAKHTKIQVQKVLGIYLFTQKPYCVLKSTSVRRVPLSEQWRYRNFLVTLRERFV